MKTFVLLAATLLPATFVAQAQESPVAAFAPSVGRAWHRAGPPFPGDPCFERNCEPRQSHPRKHRWCQRSFRRLGPDFKLRTAFDPTVNPRMRIGRPDPSTDFKMLVPAEPWETWPRARRHRQHRCHDPR